MSLLSFLALLNEMQEQALLSWKGLFIRLSTLICAADTSSVGSGELA